MRGLFAGRQPEGVRQPILILATDNDKLVGYGPIARAAARLPNVQLINYGTVSHHEILREADAVRVPALAAADAFLDRIAGGGGQ